MKNDMKKIEKIAADNEIFLKVITSDGTHKSFRANDECKIVATGGRPIIGKISYIGDAHLEVNTNTHKLMILFSSIYSIEKHN